LHSSFVPRLPLMMWSMCAALSGSDRGAVRRNRAPGSGSGINECREVSAKQPYRHASSSAFNAPIRSLPPWQTLRNKSA
jgi:hypothetical protein